MAELIRQFDWTATPLGALASWPATLTVATSLILRSNAPMALLWGAQGVMIYNDAYRVVAGERHPALLGSNVAQGWPEATRFHVQVLKRVLAGESLSYRDEHFVLRRHGAPEDVWFSLDYSPVVDAENVPLGALAVVKETTARVLAQQRLQLAREVGGIGMFEWYPPSGRLEVCEQYRRIWGMKPDAAVTDHMLVRLIHPDDRGTLGAHPGGTEGYVEFRHVQPATGEVRWIAQRSKSLTPRGSSGMRHVGIVADITERKASQDALFKSEARFRLLAQSMPNQVWTATAEGELDWFNERVYEYTGASVGSLDGSGWMAYVHPDDLARAQEAWRIACESGRTHMAEFRLRRNDGAYVWFLTRALPICNETGNVQSWIGNSVDIEDRKSSEIAALRLATALEERVAQRTSELLHTQEALRHGQKLESIGKLTGGVAHDFNNLLQVISGNLHLLQADVGDNADARRRLEQASTAVARGSKLASQLLSFGRRQVLAPQVVNVAELISSMGDMLRRTLGEGIELKTRVDGALWKSLIDPANLENALLNLAINARDAMEGRGRLTIEASNAVVDDAFANLHPGLAPGPYVTIAVADTGCGIAPEILESVFEPFFTTKPDGRGTGLGLSMVYGFVKQSHGHIQIHSEPTRGTSFMLYLPRSTLGEDSPSLPGSEPLVGGNETILVVEDDEDVRLTVVAMLEDLGYRVLKARDAQSALSIIDSGVSVDLLFTDVVMPGELRSPELAQRARQRLPALCVLFTSGYTDDVVVHGGRLDESIALLSKPYTQETLARTLRQILWGIHTGATTAPDEGGVATRSVPSAGPVRPARPLSILLCEDDALIRGCVAEMLASKGHHVHEAGSAARALAIHQQSPIDLLVTDVGLPDASGIELARQMQQRAPQLPVLFATGLFEGNQVDPDSHTAVILKPFGVDELLDAIHALIARSS